MTAPARHCACAADCGCVGALIISAPMTMLAQAWVSGLFATRLPGRPSCDGGETRVAWQHSFDATSAASVGEPPLQLHTSPCPFNELGPTRKRYVPQVGESTVACRFWTGDAGRALHDNVSIVVPRGDMLWGSGASNNWVHLPERKRFWADASDIFLGNNINAKRLKCLLGNSRLVGAEAPKLKAPSPKNTTRDIRRTLLKGSKWPKPYLARVPCLNPKTIQLDIMVVS